MPCAVVALATVTYRHWRRNGFLRYCIRDAQIWLPRLPSLEGTFSPHLNQIVRMSTLGYTSGGSVEYIYANISDGFRSRMGSVQVDGKAVKNSEGGDPTFSCGSHEQATPLTEEVKLEEEILYAAYAKPEKGLEEHAPSTSCGVQEVDRLFRLVAEGTLDKLSSSEVQQLQQLDENGYVLRHVLHREHSDAQTARVLQMMLLPPAEHKPDGEGVDLVSAALVEKLLRPYQPGERRLNRDEESTQIQCLCGLPVVDGVFSCSRNDEGSATACSESGGARSDAHCRRIRAVPLAALAHALCSCCLQGKLRSLLLLERCCSVPAANDKLLRQGRGSLVHSAAIGGSRAILVRLVEMHGFSPRGVPGWSSPLPSVLLGEWVGKMLGDDIGSEPSCVRRFALSAFERRQ